MRVAGLLMYIAYESLHRQKFTMSFFDF